MVLRFKNGSFFGTLIDVLALTRGTIKSFTHVMSNLGGGSRYEFVSA
jgi:hypothetical protein